MILMKACTFNQFLLSLPYIKIWLLLYWVVWLIVYLCLLVFRLISRVLSTFAAPCSINVLLYWLIDWLLYIIIIFFCFCDLIFALSFETNLSITPGLFFPMWLFNLLMVRYFFPAPASLYEARRVFPLGLWMKERRRVHEPLPSPSWS